MSSNTVSRTGGLTSVGLLNSIHSMNILWTCTHHVLLCLPVSWQRAWVTWLSYDNQHVQSSPWPRAMVACGHCLDNWL